MEVPRKPCEERGVETCPVGCLGSSPSYCYAHYHAPPLPHPSAPHPLSHPTHQLVPTPPSHECVCPLSYPTVHCSVTIHPPLHSHSYSTLLCPLTHLRSAISRSLGTLGHQSHANVHYHSRCLHCSIPTSPPHPPVLTSANSEELCFASCASPFCPGESGTQDHCLTTNTHRILRPHPLYPETTPHQPKHQSPWSRDHVPKAVCNTSSNQRTKAQRQQAPNCTHIMDAALCL